MEKEERFLKRKRRIEEMENYGLDVGFYQNELRQRHGQDARRPDEGIRHSGSYHRYFEGYSEQKVPGENGHRNRIVRVYVGDYYKRKCSDCAWIAVKAAYALLYLAAVAVYLFAMVLPIGSNHAWYVALPGLLSVVPLILVFAKLTACLVTKRTMMIYDFKYVFHRVVRYCTAAAGFLFATALMKLLYILVNLPGEVWPEVFSCLGCFLGAGLILGIGLLERNAKYEIIKNKNVPSEDGFVL